MDNATRLDIYRRDRTALTPAQQRRYNRHARRDEHQVVVRASRLRKALERGEQRRLRREAVELINAMRLGVLRKSAQEAMRRQRALEQLRRVTRS